MSTRVRRATVVRRRTAASLLALSLGAAASGCRANGETGDGGSGLAGPGQNRGHGNDLGDARAARPEDSGDAAIDGAGARAVPAAIRAVRDAARSGAEDTAGDAGPHLSRIVPLNDVLQASVCGNRRPCRVIRVRRAGAGVGGRPLYVATADLGFAPADDPEAGSGESPPELSSTDTGDTTEPAPFGQGCHRYEFWLAAGAHPPRATQLLYESCNDGYGAAGVGSDGVEVEDGEVTIARSGGSNWRWGGTWRLALDPVRVRFTDGSGAFAGGGHEDEETWSWDDFRGSASWSAPPCDATGGAPDEEAEDDGDADSAAGPPHRYLLVPQVTLEPDFERAGWRTTRLDPCAAHVDATGKRGFVTYGGAGDADDASFAVVASQGGTLYLEIHDDRWTGPTDRWVADDHVELWLAPEPLTYMSACVPRADDTLPKQWAIRVADGRVFAGFGRPSPADLAVERAKGDGVVRLRVAIPRDAGAITVVYSDGDDGVRQKRLIATSALEFGRRASLGELHAVPADEAVCTVQGGALRPKVTRRLERTRAVVGRED